MKSKEREPDASSTRSTTQETEPYTAPEIIWEQEFVALALVSPPCNPNSDPNCNN